MKRLTTIMQAAIALACVAITLMATQIPAVAYDNNLPLNPIIINPTMVGGTAKNLTLANPVIGNTITPATARAVNTTTDVSVVTIPQNISTLYIATPSSVAATLTMAAPTGDGERRRVCFGGAISTVTWAVTAPASAVVGLPTSVAADTCVEAYYNAVAGTPANSEALTWYQY